MFIQKVYYEEAKVNSIFVCACGRCGCLRANKERDKKLSRKK